MYLSIFPHHPNPLLTDLVFPDASTHERKRCLLPRTRWTPRYLRLLAPTMYRKVHWVAMLCLICAEANNVQWLGHTLGEPISDCTYVCSRLSVNCRWKKYLSPHACSPRGPPETECCYFIHFLKIYIHMSLYLIYCTIAGFSTNQLNAYMLTHEFLGTYLLFYFVSFSGSFFMSFI